MSDYRPEIVNYICERFAQEDEVLQGVLEAQKAGGGPMMNIGPDQGKFLNLLVKFQKPKNILELGSYYGYSALWIARGIKELKEGSKGAERRLNCVEVSEQQCVFLKGLFEKADLSDVVEIHQGAGLDMMNKFINEGRQFEMIFVDADKANYSNYLELSTKLLPSGGLLLVDNCLWDGKVVNANTDDKQTQSIQAFNDALAKHPDFDSTVLTVQDGLAFAIKC